MKQVQIFTRNFINILPGFETGGEPIGGAEVYLHNLSKLFISMGFDIEIIQAGDNNNLSEFDGIRVRTIEIKGVKKKLFPLILPHIFSNMEDKNALKIYNGPEYAMFRNRDNGPAVGIFHGVPWDPSFYDYVILETKYRRSGACDFSKSCIRYLYFHLFMPYAVKRSLLLLDKVVSVDSNVLNYLPKNLLSKIDVVYNFVDCKLFNSNKGNQNNEGVKKILVPRNFNVGRGVYLVPGICKLMLQKRNDFEFLLAGSGPLKEYLEKEICSANLQRYIKLIGHVSHEEMAKLYNEVDFVLIPSVYSEGTTLAALEAMASQKLLFCTDVGGLREIGRDGVNKIVVGKNVQDITDKINYYFDNPSEGDKIAKNARDYVCRYFNKEIWEQKWKEIITNELDKKV